MALSSDDLYRSVTEAMQEMTTRRINPDFLPPIGGLGGLGGMGVKGGMNAATHTAAYEMYDIGNPNFRASSLAMRMRRSWEDLCKALPGLSTTVGDDTVFVHFARNGELAVFPDDAANYPSDKLVNSLRLCIP